MTDAQLFEKSSRPLERSAFFSLSGVHFFLYSAMRTALSPVEGRTVPQTDASFLLSCGSLRSESARTTNADMSRRGIFPCSTASSNTIPVEAREASAIIASRLSVSLKCA